MLNGASSMVRMPGHLIVPVHIAAASGPLVYLELLGQPVLVLNSYDAAVELLEKRSQIYSDRPKLCMAGELCVTRPRQPTHCDEDVVCSALAGIAA